MWHSYGVTWAAAIFFGLLCADPGTGRAAENAVQKQPTEPQEGWREAFNQAYTLNQGQVLRYIAPPFIPERDEYYKHEMPWQWESIPHSPTSLTFHQDRQGGLSCEGARISARPGGTPLSLAGVLAQVAGMKQFEYEGNPALLELAVPGDWTLRAGTPKRELLAALEPVVEQVTGQKVRFTQRWVERDALVVTGLLEPTGGDRVLIYAEEHKDASGGGSGSLNDFVRWVGNALDLPVFNEAKSEQERLAWRQFPDARIPSKSDNREQAVRLVLENLAGQTGLTFEVKPRRVAVWFVTHEE